MTRIFLTVLFLTSFSISAFSQVKDSTAVKDTTLRLIGGKIIVDTVKKEKHSPRKAAIRSAILPGWGQFYNKKYWKIPIVYTAIGIPTYLFFDNKNWYQKTRDAAKLLASDTTGWRDKVDRRLYIFFTTSDALGSLLNYRNEFRRNMDYSVLFVLIFWGLNVIDATVDAHLKGFDITDDLSLKIKPTIISGTNNPGISLVLSF